MNLLSKIKNIRLLNFISKKLKIFNRENLEVITDSLAITNYNENKISYVLYCNLRGTKLYLKN